MVSPTCPEPGIVLSLQGIFGQVWRGFWLLQGERRVILTSSGQRLGMLLKILKCLKQHPEEKEVSTPKYYSATVEKPWNIGKGCHSFHVIF